MAKIVVHFEPSRELRYRPHPSAASCVGAAHDRSTTSRTAGGESSRIDAGTSAPADATDCRYRGDDVGTNPPGG
ncbi:hypothetical protein A2J04_26845 [Rhodococcus sp. EPR-279]|nr:hypothetical protein A2J02_26730 [Rhodococcus sp. EPR-147]KZF03486.1 hypothetical protein A2J04_26845 [Rhodococcus sp. EPR-279]